MIELTLANEPSRQGSNWINTGNKDSAVPRCCGPPNMESCNKDILGKQEQGMFGPGTWMGTPNFSDYDGYLIPASMMAWKQVYVDNWIPACKDSGMKTTYLEPIFNSTMPPKSSPALIIHQRETTNPSAGRAITIKWIQSSRGTAGLGPVR